jgi:hypothetical protein
MNIQIYTTNEICDSLWEGIVVEFNRSFEDHQTTKEKLLIAYQSNPFGYSYHSVCRDEDRIIGFNTIIPYYYYHNNQKIILGLSCSTFVTKEYRKDIFIYHDMHVALQKYCVKRNLIAFIGVSNKNSYQYSLKFLKSREIGSLNYYILPIRGAKIVKKDNLTLLNWFSLFGVLCSFLVNYLIISLCNCKGRQTPYRIVNDESFYQTRFMADKYKTVKKGDKQAWYRIINEDGIQTAYIMDFSEKNRRSVHSLIWISWHIFLKEKVDMIMYVGTMNMNQLLLLRVPKKFEPKKLPLTYNLLKVKNHEEFSDMQDVKNWDFGLLNLDVK